MKRDCGGKFGWIKKEAFMRFPEFIEKLPEVEFVAPGAQARVIQAPNHQVVFLSMEGDMAIAEHSHEAQWEIPLQGSAEMTIAGRVKVYGPGQPFYVPAGAPHRGKIKGPYTAILIFDQPNRYRIKK
jgi:quercetin dioxygenase-like cupin family protein